MKQIFIILSVLALQACGSLATPTSPEDVITRANASQFGYKKNTVTINKSHSSVLSTLETKMKACYSNTVRSQKIMSGGVATGGTSDIFHIDKTAKSSSLTILAVRRVMQGLVIGGNEHVYFAIEIKKINNSKTEVTEYHTIGWDNNGKSALLWAQAKQAPCPLKG